MKIGLLVTSISNFGQKGYYNSQEIGLAKALSKYAEKVEVYKLIPSNSEASSEIVENYNNVCVHFCPAIGLGINGFLNAKFLDKTLSCIIHFADTQFSVPRIYKWCKNHHVRYIPYVGVIESHSENTVIRMVTDFLFRRNLSVFKKSHCCVKTPYVQNGLAELGVENTTLTPVGLDEDLMNTNYLVSPDGLKQEFGFQKTDRIVLFVGRLVPEKHPLEMFDIFYRLTQRDPNYKLLIVGNGKLKADLDSRIMGLGLENGVTIIDRIENHEIWKLYRLADVFVNLNAEEIFGMALLEAMYYECPIVAIRAPGPEFIVEDGKNGFLVDFFQDVDDKILGVRDLDKSGHQRIVDFFLWNRTAETMFSIICGEHS